MPPSSRTIEYDALLTTTLENYQPRLRDNITKSNKFYAYMESRGRVRRVNGGERIRIALMYSLNSTADIYSNYGQLDTTPQDGITAAFFEWTQMAVSITISRAEERKNSGQAALLDLLQSKTMQAENSAKELLNNCLVSGRITASSSLGRFLSGRGKLDTSAEGPLPLPALIDANPSRSVSIGNINGNTYAFWRNVANSSTASTYQVMRREMNNTYNDCSKGVMGNPDLLLGDQDAWEMYWSGLESKEQYIVTDPRVIDVLGGSEALRFRGGVFIWDEVVPDVETNATVVGIGSDAAVGSATTSNIFFLNSDAMEIIVDSESDWITTPFVRPVGQDAKVAEILFMGATTVNNRRKVGVLYGIDRAIAA